MLSGEKVYLKLVEFDDIPNRVKWINDPEVQNTLVYDIPTSLSKTTEWYKKTIMDNTRREFSIFTKDGENIGFCGLINYDIKAKKAEFHFLIGNKSYWNGGYGTETCKLLMEYGFEELGLNKIYAYYLLHNKGSCRVFEKLGWIKEGLFKEEIYGHGKLWDVYYVAIFRKEWLKNK